MKKSVINHECFGTWPLWSVRTKRCRKCDVAMYCRAHYEVRPLWEENRDPYMPGAVVVIMERSCDMLCVKAVRMPKEERHKAFQRCKVCRTRHET